MEKQSWHEKVLHEHRRKIAATVSLMAFFGVSMFCYRYAFGYKFEWQSITPIPEPDIFDYRLLSALVFRTFGAALFASGFYLGLRRVCSDKQSFEDAKAVIWLCLTFIMYKVLTPLIAAFNAILSFGFNMYQLLLYIAPPLAISLAICTTVYLLKRHFSLHPAKNP